MNLSVLLCLLLAHFIADFPLQFQKVINLRTNTASKLCLLGNSIHAGIHFSISMIFVIYYWSTSIIYIVFTISFFHFIVDLIKSLAIKKKPFRKYSTKIFLMDQLVHLLVINFSLYLINMDPPVSPQIKILTGDIVLFFTQSIINITFIQKTILALVLLLIGLWGVGIFIRLLFSGINLKQYAGAINLKIELITSNKKEGANDGGFTIGILERFFIIISIVLNMPLVIGFILTAKSVARLKKFDDDRFVEIFIIGSFISFISAIIIGYIIKELKIFPY